MIPTLIFFFLIFFDEPPEKGLTYRYLASTVDELEKKSFLFFASISRYIFMADIINGSSPFPRLSNVSWK